MDVNRALYLIGEPGSGKTTLLRALLPELATATPARQPFAHYALPGARYVLGDYSASRGPFGGTDALSMSALPTVLDWLETTRPRTVIGEGDRLSVARFFAALYTLGYRTDIVLLAAPADTLAVRRAARGSQQSPTWLAGRHTKIVNLGAWVGFTLDARAPTAELVETLRQHPALAASATVSMAEPTYG